MMSTSLLFYCVVLTTAQSDVLYPLGGNDLSISVAPNSVSINDRNEPWGIPLETITSGPLEGLLQDDGFFVYLWSGGSMGLTANPYTHQYFWESVDTATKTRATADILGAFGDVYPHNEFVAAKVHTYTLSNFTHVGGDDTTPTNTVQFLITYDLYYKYTYWMINVGDINWWDNNGNYPQVGLSYADENGDGTGFRYDIPGSGTADIQNTLLLGNSNVPGRWIWDMKHCYRKTCVRAPNGIVYAPPVNVSAGESSSLTSCCDSGFSGLMCETNITAVDACSTSPCVNGQCQNDQGQYTCTCTAGYTSTNCDVDIDDCANMPCIHGNCTDDVNGFNCSCDFGYTGNQCETNIDDCSTNDCQNGYCVDGLGTFTCTCFPGWIDNNCTTNIDDCTPDPCVNGTCTDLTSGYNCTCDEGFSGRDCEINIDDCEPKPCVRGSCTDGDASFTCSCEEGFTGRLCETNIDNCSTNPCVNGVCVDQEANYTCECFPGWSGLQCDFNDDDCNPDPCANGDCTDLINGYNCSCQDGFSGQRCDININDCLYSPCAYGVCVDDVAFYNCTCSAGYTGRLCEINIDDCDPDPCEHGFCEDRVDAYSCRCFRGWQGVNCTEDTDDCTADLCNNGTCTDLINGYNCTCQEGYSGQHCEININDCELAPCVRGSCTDGVASFTCSCEDGFSGRLCEVDIDDCSKKPCVNGVCLDQEANYTCKCYPGWSGLQCDFNEDDCDPDPCVNGACTDLVNSFNCTCHDGYTGSKCTIDIDDCANSPCANGGQCVDDVDSFNCTCLDGFTGRLCEVDIDECETKPCQNGVCLDGVNTYACQCYPGFTGTDCSGDINSCQVNPCKHGTCADVTREYSCTCDAGYSGKDCEIDINECQPNPCIHGTCDSSGAANSYTCNCQAGYTGVRCEIDINECDAKPCINGSCIDGVNGFECLWCGECKDDLCATPKDYCLGNTACQNGGTCISVGVPLQYYCKCVDGFSGRHCEIDRRPPVGTFSDWSSYDDCSKTCDTGLQSRARSCLREPCAGSTCQTKVCNTNPCKEDKVEVNASVQLISSKDLKEVVAEEPTLKIEVAEALNDYCSTHSIDCCSAVGKSVSGNFPITVFRADHVHFSRGSPSVQDALTVQMRIYAIIPADLKGTCDAGKRVRRQTADNLDLLPIVVLDRALGDNVGKVNGDLCCYHVVGAQTAVPQRFWAALIGVSVSFGFIILLLFFLVFIQCPFPCVKRRKRKPVANGHISHNKKLSGTRYIPSYKKKDLQFGYH